MERGDVNARYDLDPRTESGTFRSVSDPDIGTYSSVALAYLGRRQPNKDQRDEAGIAADAEATLWQVWDSELATDGVTPKVGDQIVDSTGAVWVVRLVKTRLMGTRYHCVCTKAG